MNNLLDKAKEYFLDHKVATYALLTVLALILLIVLL